MQTSVLVGLWAIAAFILFKITSFALEERHHRANERRLGCERPVQIQSQDGLGILNIIRLFRADRDRRIPEYIRQRIETFCEKRGKAYNTFYQNILGISAIFTIDPKNIQTVLATQFKDFGLGETRNSAFAPLLGDGIFSSDGKQWEHSRALLRPQFVREQVSDLDLEERHVQNLMRCLPVNSDGWTNVTDIQTLFFRLTMDSATEFLFGESIDAQLAALPGHSKSTKADAAQFATSFDQAQAQIAKSMRLGDKYWLLHSPSFKQHVQNCHTFIDSYVHRALATPLPPSPSSSSTPASKPKYIFLNAVAESTRDPLFLRHQLLSILLAGRDTTASLLSFLVLELVRNPSVFAKLRATILDTFGPYTPSPRTITFASLKSCSYLQWTLNEALRLYPIVAIDGRRALRDTTLPTGGGPSGTSPVYVRKGQQVDYCTYAMHRRRDVWGDDVDDFRPERWEGRRPGWEYLPFNGGPRICIGQQFALTETGYVVVRLLQRFAGLEGAGNEWEGGGEVRQWLTLTACPADGVRVRLREAGR